MPGAGETDLDGAARVNGPRIDLGADEATVCGNGIVEAPEVCDDGNPCTPTDACSAGTCAGARAPGAGCRTAAAGSFQITPTSHPLVWKWTHGAATSAAEFGDPADTPIDYTLCVYDTAGTPDLAFRARAPGGATCHGKPCWKTSPSGTVTYASRAGTGLLKLTLKPSANGETRITARAAGGDAALPALPLAQDPALTVQLRRTGHGPCWESTFAAPARQNDTTRFRDTLP